MKSHLSNLIIALRDSYLSLLPFLIVSSTGSLLAQAKTALGVHVFIFNEIIDLMNISLLFPLLLSTSLSYHLAKIYQTDRVINITLSLSILVGLILDVNEYGKILITDKSHPLLILATPIICSYLFFFLFNNKLLENFIYPSNKGLMNIFKKNFLVFFITYLISISFLHFITIALNPMLEWLRALVSSQNISITALLLFRTVLSHLLWLIGVHGGNTFDLIFDSNFLSEPITNNISAKQFLDIFMLSGGSGCCLSLCLAIYIFSKDKHSLAVVKTGFPFVLFNVSEIIFYGLPVLFNKKLYIPFLVNPILNFFIFFPFFYFNIIHIESVTSITWTTPTFFNTFLLSDGNLTLVGLQLFALIANTLLYAPFIKVYTQSQSPEYLLNTLESKLNIQEKAESCESINFYQSQQKIIKSNISTHEIIKTISDNNLEVYYQPVHNARNHDCEYFEALLRLKMQDNTIHSPYFLEELEEAGFAWVIDSWVCQQVATDLAKFADYAPKVSINLHADTLKNTNIINNILDELKGFKIQFELIERASFEDDQLKENIKFIQERGYSVAIDDFGTGYSSLGNLFSAPSKTIKLDKSFSDELNSDRGSILYKHIISMCKDLGFTIIAEGIETQEQLDIVSKTGVDFIQGYYFSKALPLELTIDYVKNNCKNNSI